MVSTAYYKRLLSIKMEREKFADWWKSFWYPVKLFTCADGFSRLIVCSLVCTLIMNSCNFREDVSEKRLGVNCSLLLLLLLHFSSLIIITYKLTLILVFKTVKFKQGMKMIYSNFVYNLKWEGFVRSWVVHVLMSVMICSHHLIQQTLRGLRKGTANRTY